MSTQALSTNIIGFDEQSLGFATQLSRSALIPKTFQGKPFDVAIAIHMSHILDVSPLNLMSNLSVINGRPSLNTAFLIALAQNKKVFKGPINFRSEGSGKDLKVTAYAKNHQDEEIVSTVSIDMAQKEGWTKNPKYFSMPVHMLRYRAAAFLIRQHAPEIMMGLHTAEENSDVKKTEVIPEINKKLGIAK